MDSNRPLSEQFRVIAKKWVDADAAANLLEESKSAFLSKKMADLGDMPVSKAEMSVKASSDWIEYIEKMVSARKEAALLKVQLELTLYRRLDTPIAQHLKHSALTSEPTWKSPQRSRWLTELGHISSKRRSLASLQRPLKNTI